MRRLILLLGLPFLASGGCSLEDALENAPCESDDDCLGDQACVKTEHQVGTGEAGWCRSSGECAAGEQEGCLANGSCGGFMFLITHPSGNAYCCEASDAILLPSADFTSAQCLSCPSDLCNGNGDAIEPCLDGDSRCEVPEGSTCGCRVPADRIEDSECEDDATCGEGFVCTRTLEQLEEPQESLPEERMQEPGWCRPTDAPECVGGEQEGCRLEGSTYCPGSQTYSCTAEGRCYCCENPSDGGSFNAHVYDETDAGESAACIQCPEDACTMTSTCTKLEEPTCVVASDAVCGCMPEA